MLAREEEDEDSLILRDSEPSGCRHQAGMQAGRPFSVSKWPERDRERAGRQGEGGSVPS